MLSPLERRAFIHQAARERGALGAEAHAKATPGMNATIWSTLTPEERQALTSKTMRELPARHAAGMNDERWYGLSDEERDVLVREAAQERGALGGEAMVEADGKRAARNAGVMNWKGMTDIERLEWIKKANMLRMQKVTKARMTKYQSELETLRQVHDNTLNTFVEMIMVLKPHVLGRLTSFAARRLRIVHVFTSLSKKPHNDFYDHDHHVSMQGGFGGVAKNGRKYGKYRTEHFPRGSFEFRKGSHSLAEVLSEFAVVNPSTTHDTDEQIAWMYHRFVSLRNKFFIRRAAFVRSQRKQRNKSDIVESPRATKRQAAGGRSGGMQKPVHTHTDKAYVSTDSDAEDDAYASTGSDEADVVTGSDAEEEAQYAIEDSLRRHANLPVLPSPLPTAAAGGSRPTTNLLHPHHTSFIGSVPAVVGNLIEVRWDGDWYNASIMQVLPDRIKVHYVDGMAEEDEWIKLGSGRLQSPQESSEADSPRRSARVEASATAAAALAAGTCGKYADLAGSDSDE